MTHSPSRDAGMRLSRAAPARGLDVVWMGHPPARIDLMKAVPGGDFDGAWTSRELVVSAGVSIALVGREELIRLKRESGRPQDLLDASKLERQSESPGSASRRRS